MMKGKLLILCVCITYVSCAKILCIFPSPFTSHQIVYQTIWKELTLRGHQVTVITTNPLNDPKLTNLTEVDVSFSYKLVFETYNMYEIISTEKNLIVLVYYVHKVTEIMTIEQLKSSQVQNIIKGNETYDVVLVETASPAWYAFSSKFNCPLIGISSLDASPRTLENIGSPVNLHLYPDVNLPFGNELTFFQTLTSLMYITFSKILDLYIINERQRRIAAKYIDPDVTDLIVIERNMSVVLVNVIPGFNKVRPVVPALIELHGLHLKAKCSLPNVSIPVIFFYTVLYLPILLGFAELFGLID